ncbi:MAG: hypothetical protein ACOXZ4_05200 [Sphaerochaetaceae bacterium]
MGSKKKLGMITLDVVDRSLVGDSAKTLWPDFPFPIIYRKAHNVTFAKLVKHDRSLLADMIEAGQWLVDSGVDALVGSCGLMGLFQKDFTQKFSIPCFMSSLSAISLATIMLGAKTKVGIVAASSHSITSQLLLSAGVDPTILFHVKGLEDRPHFHEVFFELGRIVDTDVLQNEIVQSVKELMIEAPEVGIIISECTILPVYRKKMLEAAGVPILDWETALHLLYSSL